MAYPDDHTLQLWLDALRGLNVRVKKMFGCYCLYCDDQPVGWLSGSTLFFAGGGTDRSARRTPASRPGG